MLINPFNDSFLIMRCEKFVNEYIPAVKASIAHILYNEYDLKQVEISNILDITQPAVSQYIRGTRGKSRDFPKSMDEAIDEVSQKIYDLHEADDLTDDKVDDMMCEICRSI